MKAAKALDSSSLEAMQLTPTCMFGVTGSVRLKPSKLLVSRQA
jgi:hypothetical protein